MTDINVAELNKRCPYCQGQEITIPNAISDLQKYFGRQDGALLIDFARELKELTLEDKLQLVEGIRDGSLDYQLV